MKVCRELSALAVYTAASHVKSFEEAASNKKIWPVLRHL